MDFYSTFDCSSHNAIHVSFGLLAGIVNNAGSRLIELHIHPRLFYLCLSIAFISNFLPLMAFLFKTNVIPWLIADAVIAVVVFSDYLVPRRDM